MLVVCPLLIFVSSRPKRRTPDLASPVRGERPPPARVRDNTAAIVCCAADRARGREQKEKLIECGTHRGFHAASGRGNACTSSRIKDEGFAVLDGLIKLRCYTLEVTSEASLRNE